jgi:tetratricopeptide (TPR) repeat protein
MNVRSMLRISFVIALCLALASTAAAQSGRGKARAKGVVTDQEGNPVISAKVVMEFLGKDQVTFETTTNKKGEWGILGLGTGVWKITVTAEGYTPAAVEEMIQQLERNPKIEMTLVKVQQTDKPIVEDEESLLILEKGNRLFDQENYDEALTAYQEFLLANPTAYQVGLNIAECYREKAEYESAIAEYEKVLEQTSPEVASGQETAAKALAGMGECHLKQEDFEKAQEYFKRSIDTYSDNELIAYNVGEIYFSNQKLDEALHYFTVANEIKPDWSEPLYKLGLVYLNKADFANAKLYLNKFLAVESDTERAGGVRNILTQIK